MNRMLIFAHYNEHGELASHVLYTLEKIRHLFNRIVFVSNSPLKSKDAEALQASCHKILERTNEGFDLGAWSAALISESWSYVQTYDNLILMNDTCFGPLFDLKPILKQMEEADVDFWSITDLRAMNQQPDKRRINFLAFRASIILSSAFTELWEKIVTIHRASLLDHLIANGFRYTSYFSQADRAVFQSNQSDYNPDLLLRLGCPFIQTQTFAIFSHQLRLKNLLTLKSDYPVGLIEEHCTFHFHPNVSVKAINKTFPVSAQNPPDHSYETQLKTALHLHIFYVDMLDQYVSLLKDKRCCFDLYITTDSESKKNQILSILKENGMDHLLKGIYIFNNHGRDVLPWLKISDILGQYDVVGHFHTKKSPTVSNWIAESWQNKILDNLIQPLEEILQLFHYSPRLGVVITDIPHYFSAISPKTDAWGVNRHVVDVLWKKMKCKKYLNVKNLVTPIMPYGTMFWYRPQALKPLFDLNLGDADFPPEPIPADGTIAHAIERLPVYLAWNEGYDFRIALNPVDTRTEFEVLSQISESHDYRLGAFLLRFPRIIYRMCYRLFLFLKKRTG